MAFNYHWQARPGKALLTEGAKCSREDALFSVVPLSPLHSLFPLKTSKTHMTTLIKSAAALPFLAIASIGFAAETFPLASLELRMDQEYGQPHADASVDNHPLSIGGQKFEHGLGT